MNKAIGINMNGCKVEIDVGLFGILYGQKKNLQKLIIPNHVVEVYCFSNNLDELILPISVKRIYCDKDLFNYDKCSVISAHIFYD
jgi:hypothetical protein